MNKKKEGFRHWQLLLDIIVMILGIGTTLLGLFLFGRLDRSIQWLPLMFLLASIVNTMSGLKAFYYGRKAAGAGSCLTALAIFCFAVVSYITCWT